MEFNHEQAKLLGLIKKNFVALKKPFFLRENCNFYIYGDTGCGKTTIIDTLFADLHTNRKINMHFHDYFIDISRLLHKFSLDTLIKKISNKLEFIFFDEFNIDNVTDGLLLFSLFKGLIKKNVKIILTSNFAPKKLFSEGFNRERIFPDFSNFIYHKMNVCHLSSNTDYRTDSQEETAQIIYSNYQEFQTYIERFHDDEEYKGIISYNQNNNHSKIAVFDYKSIFKKPISTNELIGIARNHHLVCIEYLPDFNQLNEDEAIRFRNFIDVAYLRNINLALYSDKVENFNDLFSAELKSKLEYKRTLSRLHEMSWKKYIHNPYNKKKREWADKARDFFENL